MPRKLIDDCFHQDLRDGLRLSHDDTLALIRERVRAVVSAEEVSVDGATGRVLAQDIAAPISVPGHSNSAVDGFAFAHQTYNDTDGSWLTVVARAAAGSAIEVFDEAAAGAGLSVAGSSCVAARIFTGAVMPESLDTVVMQEDCEISEDARRVFVPAGLKPCANVRPAGEDVRSGALVLKRGQVLRAPDIATLCSLGIRKVSCFGAPRIGLVATGNEVVRGGEGLRPGEVYDVNTPMVKALAERCIGDVSDLGIWPDRRELVTERLGQAAAEFDLIITTGGASQGEEDHIAQALASLGTQHFWQIAVKPGRPLMLGQIGDTVVVGLPGNPVAVFVCFLMYVWPLIRQLGGADWREPRRFPLPANFSVPSRKLGRREFWRATTRQTENGLSVEKFARDGSGLISGLRVADGLIDVGEDVEAVVPGQLVDFIPFSEFGIVD